MKKIADSRLEDQLIRRTMVRARYVAQLCDSQHADSDDLKLSDNLDTVKDRDLGVSALSSRYTRDVRLTSFIQMSGATHAKSWNDRKVNLSAFFSSCCSTRPAMRSANAERSRASVIKLMIVQKFCSVSDIVPV